MAVTFNDNISPLFSLFKPMMTWRLDLEKYEDVKANAAIIYAKLLSRDMPPPNYAKLTDEQIAMFKQWMDDGYPEK